MKRPLDLNPHASRILGLAVTLGLVLPAAVWLVARCLGLATRPLVGRVMLGSALLGMAVLGGLLILVVIEQVQDTLFDALFRARRGRKLPLRGGLYECQFCGNRQVAERDRACSVCGRRFS